MRVQSQVVDIGQKVCIANNGIFWSRHESLFGDVKGEKVCIDFVDEAVNERLE